MIGTKQTLNDRLTSTNKNINLPRHNVIDKITLDYAITVKASTVKTITYADVMDVLKEIRVVANGNIVHYNLSGLDIAIMNLYDHGECGMIHPDTEISLAIATPKTVEFTLLLERGDLLASTRQSLELTHALNDKIGTDITVESVEADITISEKIFESDAEFDSVYAYNPKGGDIDRAAEPKISIIGEEFKFSNEPRNLTDVPVGCLSRRIFFISHDTNKVRGAVEPVKLGINVTNPQKIEMYNMRWKTMQHHNQADYHTKKVNGVVVLDFGEEVTGDGYGIRAWEFNRGDYVVTTRADAPGWMRMIHEEYVVNTAVFDADQAATIEA